MQLLSSALEHSYQQSSIDETRFIPLDRLKQLITKENVQHELKDSGWLSYIGLSKASDVPSKVERNAQKLFAILVSVDKTSALAALLNEGLNDSHLPLSLHPDIDAMVSCDGSTHFVFQKWSRPSLYHFANSYQWPMLAPIIKATGDKIEVNSKCPLPFLTSTTVDQGAAGIVYQATIHPAHQIGLGAETVAVKEFLNKDDFVKENDILQQIKSLQHPHILRHLYSISRGKRGYIILPWADGGNLSDFWERQDHRSEGRVLWSLKQMLGLSDAVHVLHEQFKCRHGDLKPGNILCVTEHGKATLKIADFGVSRIHHAQTMYRKVATSSNFLTPSYQGPEVEFEKINRTDEQPRSRKYDVWSLGCVFLEFTLWLLHGPTSIEKFAAARGRGISSQDTSRPLYEITDRARRAAKVHKLVTKTIETLQSDPRCVGDSALGALLKLIGEQMLQPVVENRPWANEISAQLKEIVWKAERNPEFLLHACNRKIVAPDFASFL